MSGMAWNEPNELPKTPSYLERAEIAEAKIEQYKAVVLLAEEGNQAFQKLADFKVGGEVFEMFKKMDLEVEVQNLADKLTKRIQSLRAANLLDE